MKKKMYLSTSLFKQDKEEIAQCAEGILNEIDPFRKTFPRVNSLWVPIILLYEILKGHKTYSGFDLIQAKSVALPSLWSLCPSMYDFMQKVFAVLLKIISTHCDSVFHKL